MKAIILAAGLGSRLDHLTRNSPKCLLEVAGNSILQHQIDALRESGADDIAIVKGYLADRINLPGCRYYINEDYESTNMLSSLMCASEEMTTEFIATYSDILFEPRVVSELMSCTDDIAVVIDTDWRARYAGRDQHPVSEAEKVICDGDFNLQQIGKELTSQASVTGEFIGMMKCSTSGAEMIKCYYEKARAAFGQGPFINAKFFANAYLTDLLQFLLQEGISIRGVPVQRGWVEIDTAEDLEFARRTWLAKGSCA